MNGLYIGAFVLRRCINLKVTHYSEASLLPASAVGRSSRCCNVGGDGRGVRWEAARDGVVAALWIRKNVFGVGRGWES